MRRAVAAVISIGLIGAALEPLVRAPDDDGFPLATFPMFAIRRPTRIAMSYAEGVTGDGRPRALSPALLGTGEVMQAFTRLQRAADAGPEACRALCAEIAARVATDAAYADVVAIRIASATHDAVAYVVGGPGAGGPADEVTRARCVIEREPR